MRTCERPNTYAVESKAFLGEPRRSILFDAADTTYYRGGARASRDRLDHRRCCERDYDDYHISGHISACHALLPAYATAELHQIAVATFRVDMGILWCLPMVSEFRVLASGFRYWTDAVARHDH